MSVSPRSDDLDEGRSTSTRGPRRRAWKPKVKTGCITCRIRKVKCDEEKPSCHRCSSTGRKCDGYTETSSALVTTRLLAGPSVLPGVNSKEHESFIFFCRYTAAELGGFFEDSFWMRGVLQASHLDSAVRHAVTALGAIHERFLACDVAVVPDNPSDDQIRFALQQCNKAIQDMVGQYKTPSQSQRVTALMISILLTCFSSMQGYQAQALIHMRSGLSLLEEGEKSSNAVTGSYPISMESLRRMFTNLDLQARAMVNDEMLATWNFKSFLEPVTHPASFASWTDAHIFFEACLNKLLALLSKFELSPPLLEDLPAFMAEFESHSRYFAEGQAELVAYLCRLQTPPNKKEQKYMSVLKLYTILTHIIFTTFSLEPELGEMAWDASESHFFTIVDIATELLLPGSFQAPDDPTPRRPFFTFGFGVVQPLFLVGSRCRNPSLRRKAIDLLLRFPRREGIWDSVLAGRVAHKMMLLEELDSDMDESELMLRTSGELSYQKRIRGIEIDYTGPRTATVTYVTTEQWSKGENGVEWDLDW